MIVSAEALSLLVVAAFGAGFVDAIAGGGGLITVPALLAAQLPPHLALGTNKGQSTFGAISSAVSFWRRGGVDRARAPIAFAGGLLGALGGAALLLQLRPEPLRPIVIGLLVVAAVIVATRPRVHGPGLSEPLQPFALAGATLLLGAYDGFFGPGVGTMLIVAFTLIYGDAVTRASGNAKITNLGSNLASLAIFAWKGTVLWSVALPMALANALGAAAGARVALRRGDRFVRAVVLLVVLALVTKLALDLVRSRL